jgi:DNA invertase Pin-like site-specific DNA recombinase
MNHAAAARRLFYQPGFQDARERQAIGIALGRKRGVYTGRRPGTTKAAPARARTLRKQGLTVLEIAHARGVQERTVYNYTSRGR